MKLTSDKTFGVLVRSARVIQTVMIAALTVLMVAAVVAAIYRYMNPPCDYHDPWACFGGARYEAMARGDVCSCYAKKYLT